MLYFEPRPRSRTLANFIEPCLPRPADRPPIGGDWLHEIKHDGFRIMARRDAAGVRLLTRNGHDFAGRFPMAAAAVATLPARSCLIDGEAIVTDQNGLAVFDLIRGHRWSTGGSPLRLRPARARRRGFASRADRNPQEHPEVAAARQVCGNRVQRAHSRGWRNRLPAGSLGCEGIVSKRLGSPYRSGRADCWIKVKNPAAPAVRREAEEEWN